MTRIYILRHGNTFDKGDVVTRVGGRTDLPLSVSGLGQAEALSEHFAELGVKFDMAFCSPLQRTKQTAQIALKTQAEEVDLKVLPFLVEVDYGPDENKPEDEVLARIGADALKAWEEEGIPPNGWHIDPPAVIGRWQEFFASAPKKYPGKTLLVVTSNGIARFALKALRDGGAGADLKLKTAAYGVFDAEEGAQPLMLSWNVRP
ncbi:Alpha-ribazole phosphatase [Pseudovibrio axinellae]|uniref:Alpha-ribazole phosphatase n=1 Tax=Pseudovibrio axinellae TaxID=989403 RepID=A0A166AR63_9HYPH|nr:histidine phosphatase family protein [Pseudovibrio axinellae]KZL21451.1 Alpha-ribazole phosphatase [Pseudovibrio axinellae]SER05779.1 probable phosphoglycerate mutase [Pseudovibrio axinellae]